MSKQHRYQLTTQWNGNKGTGTSSYAAYERAHSILVENKAEILCSSDPAFRGDRTKHNPEDFLIASLSSCHMLWYLHLCADAGVIVVEYVDNAHGLLQETEGGGGRFTEVELHPIVTVTESSMVNRAMALHHKAHELCFIANSVNFPVHHKPTCRVLVDDDSNAKIT